MNKLRVGIIADQEYVLERGGESSYYHVLLNGINEFTFDERIEMINIVFCPENCKAPLFKKESIVINSGRAAAFKSVVKIKTSKQSSSLFSRRNVVVRYISDIVSERKKRKTEEILRSNNIDLVYYLRPEMEVLNYPFIATHWDVGHKSMYGFPEVSMDGNYEKRENYYLQTLNKAFLILCESETGFKELKKYYSLYNNKLKTLPIFGGDVIKTQVTPALQAKILLKFHLEKDKFFVYPAQFWAHKNHYNLICAFKQLVTEISDKNIKLVLCGSDKGNMDYIKSVIKQLGITEQVLIPGFVSNETLGVFYRNAIALSMPTFLGPTNLPLIEAAHLQCAVVCSALEGHKEMLGENAVYFNPEDEGSIKNALRKVMDLKFRDDLVHSAKEYITDSHFNLSDSLKVLNNILVDAIPIRKTWEH